jgi:RimJ/RimL family protein N-acetyltransferase
MACRMMHGEKVRISALRDADLDTMIAWYSTDFAMLRRLGQHPVYPYTRADLERWQQANSDDPSRFDFGIHDLAEDRLIGFCVLFHVDGRSRHAELGITLGEKRGQGYGRDAVRVLLRYGFMELNLHRIYLVVQGDNPRAIKSYEHAGFVHEGATREAMLREGRYADLVWMSVLRREWEET